MIHISTIVKPLVARHEYWEEIKFNLLIGDRDRKPYYVCYEYQTSMKEDGEKMREAISALKQEAPILDKIKADIEKSDGMYVLRDRVFYEEKDPKYAGLWYVRLKEVIDILDKYKEESEEQE